MGTNVHLTPELERFARSCARDGRYNNVSEVVRSALRLLQEQEERRVAFVASLQAATAEAERDGFVPASAVKANVLQAIDAVARHWKG
jgi:antitoxin ParD1/3/4